MSAERVLYDVTFEIHGRTVTDRSFPAAEESPRITWQWWLPRHRPSAQAAAQAMLIRAAEHEWPGAAVDLIDVSRAEP